MSQSGSGELAPWRGILAYLALTFVLAWLPAWLLGGTSVGQGSPIVTRLLTCSLFYGLSMGWQPVAAVWIVRRWVDPPGYLDQGIRPVHFRVLLRSGAAAMALAVAAIAVARGLGASASLQGNPEPELALKTPSLGLALAVSAAFAATGALIGGKSLGEEIGWRGFLLTRLMQRLGPWRGLCVHGVAWGVWYAPIFLLASGDPRRHALASAGFILTFSLLGVLLGWLRLSFGSIAPSAVANAVLALAAGLPFLLLGVDVGLRGSAYGPPGWVLMAVVIAVLATGKWRAAVTTPAAPPARRLPRFWVVIERRLGPGASTERRTLH